MFSLCSLTASSALECSLSFNLASKQFNDNAIIL